MAYQYCSNCGSKLNILEEGELESQTCLACGTTHYHNSRPCAGALVVQHDSVLLVKRGIEPFKDHWDIPGGFLQPGEHPEDGVRREVFEETGLEVRLKELHGIYIDQYDDDPRPTLNIYYLAEPVGGVPRPSSDAVELTWFTWDHIPERIAFAHAPRVLADWREKRLELISI